MQWEIWLAIEIALTIAAMWLGRYSWVCVMVASLRLAALILTSIGGSR